MVQYFQSEPNFMPVNLQLKWKDKFFKRYKLLKFIEATETWEIVNVNSLISVKTTELVVLKNLSKIKLQAQIFSS